jgi:hypothetical protein
VLSCEPAESLWHVVVYGDAVLDVTWGRTASGMLRVDTPLVADFLGRVSIQATARSETLIQTFVWKVWGAGIQQMRRHVAPLAFPAALDDQARSFVSTAAATVISVRGTLVPVPATARLPLVSGSTITAGSGFLEFSP